jgi:hypothetical protein
MHVLVVAASAVKQEVRESWKRDREGGDRDRYTGNAFATATTGDLKSNHSTHTTAAAGATWPDKI